MNEAREFDPRSLPVIITGSGPVLAVSEGQAVGPIVAESRIGKRGNSSPWFKPESTFCPARYTDMGTALRRAIKLGSKVWFSSGDATVSGEVIKTVREIGVEMSGKTGITDKHVIKTMTGVHSHMDEPLVDESKPGPIKHTVVFAGEDTRVGAQKEISVKPVKDALGNPVLLEDCPGRIMNPNTPNNLRMDADALVVQTSSPFQIEEGGEWWLSLGSGADLTAEQFMRIRADRVKGKLPAKVVALVNPDFPQTQQGDVLVHLSEADWLVAIDPSPAKPIHKKAEAKANPELEAMKVHLNEAERTELMEAKYKGKRIARQSGVGGYMDDSQENIAETCIEQGRGPLLAFSEVVGPKTAELIERGLIEPPVHTSFALKLLDYMRLHPEHFVVSRTSAINSKEHIKEFIDANNAVFFAANCLTQIDLSRGGAGIAAMVPVFKINEKGDPEIAGYKLQAGNGGQRVMMEAGHEHGASFANIHASRIKNGKPVSAIGFYSGYGVPVTTPAASITWYVSKNGIWRNIPVPPGADVLEQYEIGWENIRGIINNIADPEFRVPLTLEAIVRKFLPEPKVIVSIPRIKGKPAMPWQYAA